MEVTGREKNFWIVAFNKQISSGHDVMTSACVSLALIIVLVGVLLATGCTRQPAFGNMTANNSVTVSQSIVITQPVQTPFPPSGNAKPWIIINPIGIHYKFETFEINGTTNIGPDEKLRYTISRGGVVISIPGPNGASYSQYDNGAENISYGEFSISGDQKWSFWLNTSGSEFKNLYGAPFILNVTSQNLTVNNSTSFFLRNKG